MKKVPCCSMGCSARRAHHDRPYETRPHQMVDVTDDWDWKKDLYVFCSLECACAAGKFHIQKGWIHEQPGKTYLDSWKVVDVVNQEEKDLTELPSSLKIALLEHGYVHTDFVYKLAVAAFAAGRRQGVHDITGHPLRATGTQLITVERQRQIDAEGFDSEHDDKHDGGELTRAAMSYADSARRQLLGATDHGLSLPWASYWPWDEEWWKPSPEPIRNLVKAAALLAAEIDHLQRKEKSSGNSE